MKLSYRPDIDGLRAIAVLSVVIFHINKDWLPGGFLGVDVFFVISGFLITSIIGPEIKQKSFSFANFYLRRIKRILPAALFFTAITLIALFWLYLPHDFDRAAKSGFSTLVFASNFYFARNADYFASASHENPFLHTWSLAVEEQFYIFWPVILLLVYKLNLSSKRQLLVYLSLIILSVSIATYWALNPATQKLAFYMLPARFGELLIGAIGAKLLSKHPIPNKLSPALFMCGIILLLGSFVLIDEHSVFPGLLALPVCLGTLLLLIAGDTSSQSQFAYLLCNSTSVYFGKISYSLYLAHWPVLAIFRYVTQDYYLSLNAVLGCTALMWGLAHLSFRFIETPFRRKQWTFSKAFLQVVVIPSSVMATICLFIAYQKGLPERFPVPASNFSVAAENTCHTHMSGDCLIGDKSNALPVLLIGDSHAGHFLSYFDELGKKNNFAIQGISVDGCAAAFSQTNLSPTMARLKDCLALKDFVHQHLSSIKQLLIAERWDKRVLDSTAYQTELDAFLTEMKGNGMQVTLMAQVPKYLCDVNRAAMIATLTPIENHCSSQLDLQYITANQIIKDITERHDNADFQSINHLLCTTPGNCSPYLNGQIAYKDDDHLNQLAAKALVKLAPNKPDWLTSTTH